MKKLIYTGKILTIISSLILTGCKKDSKTAFPTKSTSSGNTADFSFMAPIIPNINDADGILVAVQSHNYYKVTLNPFEKTFEFGMGKFTNTKGVFSSLADAGSIAVDTTTLVEASDFSYLSPIRDYNLYFTSAINWNVSGAGSMPAASHTVTAGAVPAYTYGGEHFETWIPVLPRILVVPHYPYNGPSPLSSYTPTATHNDSVNYNTVLYPMHRDSLVKYKSDSTTRRADSVFNATPTFVVPIKNYISATDTIILILSDGASFYHERKILPTDSISKFTPNDFVAHASLPTTATYFVQLNAVKYYSAMFGSKKYYFLKMGSYIRYWKAS